MERKMRELKLKLLEKIQKEKEVKEREKSQT